MYVNVTQRSHIRGVNRVHFRVDDSLERELHVIRGYFSETVAEQLARFQAKRIMRVIDGLEIFGRIEFSVPATVCLELQQSLKYRPANHVLSTRERKRRIESANIHVIADVQLVAPDCPARIGQATRNGQPGQGGPAQKIPAAN